MNIDNAYEFFKNVKLTEDGYLIVSGGGGGGGGGSVTININGNGYKIISAPATEDVQILNQFDDQVGSLIAGEWIVQIPTFIKPDVSINSTPFKEYESGAVDNIIVKDTADVEVGSLIGGEWIVPKAGTFTDVSISLNGTFYKLYNTGDTDDILIVDQNDNQIGSLTGTKWTVTLPTFTDPVISINGTSYKAYSSGDTDNILIVDQDRNLIGSLDAINDEWSVNLPSFTDPVISINGTTFDTYGSGDTPNILIKDQNDNLIGSKVLTEWIVNLPVFTDVSNTINNIDMGDYGSGGTITTKVIDQDSNEIGVKDGLNWKVQLPTFTDPVISINGTSYKAYSSGDTDNILIVDQDRNLIGSLDAVNDEWSVNLPSFTKTKTSINSTEFNELDSGETDNILIKDQDGNLIGSKVLTEWIVQLPVFVDPIVTINSTEYKTLGSGDEENIIVKNTADVEVGELVAGEWIVPEGGGGDPEYVKTLILGTNNEIGGLSLIDVFDDGSMKPNTLYKTHFDSNVAHYEGLDADINPNDGTMIRVGEWSTNTTLTNYRPALKSVDFGETWTIIGASTSGKDPYYTGMSIVYDEILNIWHLISNYDVSTSTTQVRTNQSLNNGLTWQYYPSKTVQDQYEFPIDYRNITSLHPGKVGGRLTYSDYSNGGMLIKILNMNGAISNGIYAGGSDFGTDNSSTAVFIGICYNTKLGVYLACTNERIIISLGSSPASYKVVGLTKGLPTGVTEILAIEYDSINEVYLMVGIHSDKVKILTSTTGEISAWTVRQTISNNKPEEGNLFKFINLVTRFMLVGPYSWSSEDSINWTTASGITGSVYSVKERDLSGLM